MTRSMSLTIAPSSSTRLSGGQAPFGDADAHGATARVKTHADLTGGLDLVIKSTAVWVEIEVVHRCGAARQDQFRHGGLRRKPDHLRSQALPHRQQLPEPVAHLHPARRPTCTGSPT